jgi:hypothetical protein
VRRREDLAIWFFEEGTYLSHTVLPSLAPLDLSESDLRAIRLTVTARGEHLKAQILRRFVETEGTKTQTPAMATYANAKDPVAAERRAQVDAYIDEVYRLTARRISRTDIWKAAGYKARTDFEHWQRNHPRATKRANERFTRLFKDKPHLK